MPSQSDGGNIMTMENRPGIKVNLICTKCRKIFLRPAITIRSEQKGFFCSRECLLKTDEERRQTKKNCRNRWSAANREKIRENQKRLRNKDIEHTRKLRRESYNRHANDIQKRARENRRVNSDIVRIIDRKRYGKNSIKIKAYAKIVRQTKPEIFKIQREKHRACNRHSLMWSHCKKSAKEKGIIFNLTKEWIKNRLDAGICEMSGIPFDMTGKRTANIPSIDRVKSDGDYTQDNCRVILWSLNRALCNYGEYYMISIFKAIIKQRELKPLC